MAEMTEISLELLYVEHSCRMQDLATVLPYHRSRRLQSHVVKVVLISAAYCAVDSGTISVIAFMLVAVS